MGSIARSTVTTGRSWTALVVEDEPLVALALRQCLEDEGFAVRVAADGRTGLRLARDAGGGDPARSAPDAIDLAVLDLAVVDLGLPDMPGDEVVRALKADLPDLAVILATGYETAELVVRLADIARLVVMAKPYDGQTVRRLLGDFGFSLSR